MRGQRLCVGGGLELALACDICIASENAKFGLTEARVGSLPGSGGVQRLPRTVTEQRNADADDGRYRRRRGGLSHGHSQQVVPQSELCRRAGNAERIAANAPLAVRASSGW